MLADDELREIRANAADGCDLEAEKVVRLVDALHAERTRSHDVVMGEHPTPCACDIGYPANCSHARRESLNRLRQAYADAAPHRLVGHRHHFDLLEAVRVVVDLHDPEWWKDRAPPRTTHTDEPTPGPGATDSEETGR